MEFKDKRVIVTGGCGFIGSHLVERLAKSGAEVVVIDNLVTGRAENIEGMAGNITHHNADILGKLDDYLSGADTIFHLAANVSVTGSVENPLHDAENNIKGTLNLLEAARKLDIANFVYSSSSAVYGDDVAVPTDENQPISPSSPYGISKYVGEMYCRAYSKLYGINSVALRYFNVYGFRQRADSPYSGVIAIFIKNAIAGEPLIIYGDGEQNRDFIAVSDVVEANISAAGTKMHGEAFNIGTGVGTTVNQLAGVIEGFAGKLERIDKPPRKGDIRHSIADISSVSRALNFQPEVILEQGLKDLYSKVRNQ